MKTIKVAIADDHKLFRQGIHFLIEQMYDLELVFEASNGNELLAKLESIEVDVLLLDLDMPDMDGISFMKSLISRNIHVPVVIMSAKEDLVTLSECFKLGALGFLPKTWTVRELTDALTKIENGEIVMPDHIANSLAIMSKNSIENTQSSLSERQLEILKMVQTGLTNAGIASVLYISEATVKSHLQRIYKILGAKNRIDSVRKAEHLKILPAIK